MGNNTKHCPWCYEPAIAATWTPRYGWIDLCQRHYNETSREVIVHLLQTLEA
jgi:hypothetical protein